VESNVWHDAFYKFVALADPDATTEALREVCETIDQNTPLRGSILVAGEGINGMLAGSEDALAAFRTALADPRFGRAFVGMVFKRSACKKQPFGRLKVKRKREIVPLGIDGVDATARTGINLSPAQWRELLQQDDVLVIDNRNDFEYRLGHFKGALNPEVNNFRDFPDYVRANRDAWQGKKVAMYCTGGIRCEKTSSWLRDEGLEVYQLEGGILNYLQQMPDAERDWQGACFVFDDRVALDCHLQETDIDIDTVYDPHKDDERWRLERARRLNQPSSQPDSDGT
jgi:UPF0176 protein